MRQKTLSLPVSFRLPIDDAYKLDAWCRENSVNKSSLFRFFIHAYLTPDQHDQPTQSTAQ